MKLKKGRLIPRDDGKRIEEWVGNVATNTRSVSVAKMLAPPGWREAAQTPEFDEVLLVEKGTLTVVVNGRREKLGPGEVGLYPRNTRVEYRNDGRGACQYWSICAPAFLPELAHMEPREPSPEPSRVLVSSSHRKGRALEAKVGRTAQKFLAKLGITGSELSVSLVGDEEIRSLNRLWRRKDKATDVLSFPAGDVPAGMPGPKPLGDVVISLDTTARVSRGEGRKLEDELNRYLAHGLLHLLGLDHERSAKEAKKMASLEQWLLGARGLIP